MFNYPTSSPNPSEIGSTSNFSLQAQCAYHQGQYVTNFCKFSTCLMPLCPKCIPGHLDQHRQKQQYPDLVTIDEMHDETQLIINTHLSNLRQALQLLGKFKESKTDAHGQLHNKLQNAKLRVQQVIDQFFDELLQQLDQVTKNDKTNLDVELQQMERLLNQKIQDFQQIDQKLKTPSYLKQIVQLQTSNFLQQTQQSRVECEAFIEEISKHTLDIQIEEQELYFLKLQLGQFTAIKNAEYYRAQVIQPSVSLQNPNLYKHPYLTSDIQPKQENSPYKQLEQQVSQIYTGFVINLPDFYEPQCTQKYIHYLNASSINFLNLDWLQNPRWQELRLNCQIPIKSISARSQQGDIFIIGGYIGNQLSSQVFKIDFRQNTLISTDQIQQARHSAAALFHQNKLYVLGGQNQTEDLHTMEGFELQLNKSRSQVTEVRSQLPRMMQGGANLSVCSFRQFIIKAVPLEIFDTKLQKWTTLNISIPRGMGLIGINNSNVLIFGNGQLQLLKMIDQTSFSIETLTNAPQIGQVQNGSLIHLGKIYAITTNNSLIIGTPEGWQL